MSYLEKAADLYQMMGSGKMMDAFEKYYHPDVVIVEANGDTRNGKNAQRDAIKEWENSVQAMHGGGVGAITSNEQDGTTSVESWVDITTKDGNRMRMDEVAIQKWKDGQIIHERFYYNMPPMP